MPVAAGTRFGDCEVLGLIGEGGMGQVYRARDNNLLRDVAVKILPEELAQDLERLRRFEQEARAAAALNHPNIIAVYRFGTSEKGALYVVSELLQGQNLRERLEAGPLPTRRIIEYSLQIARGLAAAHERGIVHRDLKPENIFVTRDGVVKILDFGVAKLVMPEQSGDNGTVATVGGTEAGRVLGTVGYMSPEQVRGINVDHRSDIFSLGAILYEMSSGQRAFQGPTPADTMTAILKEDPPELTGTSKKLPPALGRIVQRCLEKDAAERFQSARDLAFNLELLSGETTASTAVVSAPSQKKNERITMLVLAVVALLFATTLGFVLARWIAPSAPQSATVVLRRLTDFEGMEEFPALSPDGKSVAFSGNVEGKRQIWVRLLAGGAPLQVTHDDADHQFPRWSADSSSLIYFSPSQEANGEGKIWEIPALGGTARPLVTSIGEADLSHDGKWIAYFRSNQGEMQLMVAGRDGSNPRTVTHLASDYFYSNVRWSPDDEMLGFQRGRTFDYDVWFVPVTGGEPQNITHDGSPLSGFAWLPDSAGVVYSSSRGSTVLYLPPMNLWSVQLGGKHARQLTFGETWYVSPDISHAGEIVASRVRVQFDLWKYPTSGTPKENVAQGKQLTYQTGAVQTPSASPGDRELVYLSDSGGHGNLWILNLENGKTRQVTFEQDPHIGLGVPVWSPDGKHIAYVTRARTGWNVDLWIVSPDGSNATKVAEGGGWACWSADSRWLYYAPPTGRGFRLEKKSPDGGSAILVREEGQRPALSPDGTLFFAVNVANVNGMFDMEIRAAKPENGTPRTLARISGARVSASLHPHPVVSPDGKWLAMVLTDGATNNLWAVSTATGELRQITDFGHEATFIARRVSWSSDGRSIYASVGKGEADIVQISNLLH